MYQLAARMGTKMMGGLGFHEVLNNVSKPENQTTVAFLLYYYILLFHSRKWQYKKSLVTHIYYAIYIYIYMRARIKIPFCLLSCST